MVVPSMDGVEGVEESMPWRVIAPIAQVNPAHEGYEPPLQAL